jgi:hypothetical protein
MSKEVLFPGDDPSDPTFERDTFGNIRIVPRKLAEAQCCIIMEQEQLLQVIVGSPEDEAVRMIRQSFMGTGRVDLMPSEHMAQQMYRNLLKYARTWGIPTFYDFYKGAMEPLGPTELFHVSPRVLEGYRRVMREAAALGVM